MKKCPFIHMAPKVLNQKVLLTMKTYYLQAKRARVFKMVVSLLETLILNLENMVMFWVKGSLALPAHVVVLPPMCLTSLVEDSLALPTHMVVLPPICLSSLMEDLLALPAHMVVLLPMCLTSLVSSRSRLI